MLKECSADLTNVEQICGGRGSWKKILSECKKHLDIRKRWSWIDIDEESEEKLQSITRGATDLVCRYEECNKECKS